MRPVEVDRRAIRDLREERAYSIRELADMSGVSRTTLARLDKQGGNAHPRTIRKLAEALGVAPKAIMRKERS